MDRPGRPRVVRACAAGSPPTGDIPSGSMMDPGMEGSALERGEREGLIDPRSPWWRLFRRDPLPVRGNRALVWTGLVVRPRAGLWLVVGGAFNRRSRISVVDHVVSDPERFVPLVVE